MNRFEMRDMASAFDRDARYLRQKATDMRGQQPAVGAHWDAVNKLDEQADLLSNIAGAIRAANP